MTSPALRTRLAMAVVLGLLAVTDLARTPQVLAHLLESA
jgi:hypothetical protein